MTAKRIYPIRNENFQSGRLKVSTGFVVIEYLVVIFVNISLMVALPILTKNIVEIMIVLPAVLVNREEPNCKERQMAFKADFN